MNVDVRFYFLSITLYYRPNDIKYNNIVIFNVFTKLLFLHSIFI